jgi:hypothetical protein
MKYATAPNSAATRKKPTFAANPKIAKRTAIAANTAASAETSREPYTLAPWCRSPLNVSDARSECRAARHDRSA